MGCEAFEQMDERSVEKNSICLALGRQPLNPEISTDTTDHLLQPEGWYHQHLDKRAQHHGQSPPVRLRSRKGNSLTGFYET
ncbi:hypothetical protein AHF37_01036 [Paragonimus kellicotti]|nr:hypothetical protein AHF37_01036 [Paragonimus kellicotti]